MHVEYEVYSPAGADFLLVGQHREGELMDDQHLRRQVALSPEPIEGVEGRVDFVRMHMPDLQARHLTFRHVEFGIERPVHIWLREERAQRLFVLSTRLTNVSVRGASHV